MSLQRVYQSIVRLGLMTLPLLVCWPAPSLADQIVCVANGAGTDTCDVVLPNVLAASTTYPSLQFAVGDIVVVTSVTGCAQTGGGGKTWKDFLNPSGPDSDRLYHGLISIPGATVGLVRLSTVMGRRLIVSASGPLMVGYEDQDFEDNGYYSHDNGTGDQCADQTVPTGGRATIRLTVNRAGASAPSGNLSGQCVVVDALHETCHIDRPDVTKATELYPSIRFRPGDTVTISAGGCVQTGGSGATWKRYVDPEGANADRLYHGLISIPGGTAGFQRFASVVGTTVTSSGGLLTLGYADDTLEDNGYWKHDDGTNGQCRGVGPAFVDLAITHLPDLAGPHVTLEGIEVTQSIQNINQSVPLVAGKETWVRVYLSSTLPPGTMVTATLTGTNGTAMPVAPVAPVALTPGAALRTLRETLARSLNFRLPAALTAAGSASFTVTAVVQANGTGTAVACGQCGTTRTVTFSTVPTLPLVIIGLTYTNPMGTTTFAPNATDFALLQSWIRRAYPISTLTATTRTVASTVTWPFTCNDANAQISGIRANDVSNGQSALSHYYGMVRSASGAGLLASAFLRGCSSGIPDSADPSTVASGPTGRPMVDPSPVNVMGDADQSFGDWYAGHELAHTFGRAHPGVCNGNTADDPHFPYPNGQISDALGSNTGLDVGDAAQMLPLTVLPGAGTFDIMTYCNQPQWLSPYAYQAVLQRLSCEAGGASSAACAPDNPDQPPQPGPGTRTDRLNMGTFIHVVASINVTAETGKIRYVLPVERAEPQRQRTDGATLITLSTTGQVLGRYPVTVRLDSDIPPGQPQTALVDASIPFTRGMARVELELRGKKIDEFSASSTRPPSPGRLRLDRLDPSGGRTLRWVPVRSGRDQITYIVELSRDSRVWETVAVGLSNPFLALTAAQVEGRYIRVTATNGFLRSASTTIRAR